MLLLQLSPPWKRGGCKRTSLSPFERGLLHLPPSSPSEKVIHTLCLESYCNKPIHTASGARLSIVRYPGNTKADGFVATRSRVYCLPIVNLVVNLIKSQLCFNLTHSIAMKRQLLQNTYRSRALSLDTTPCARLSSNFSRHSSAERGDPARSSSNLHQLPRL